MKEEEGCTHPSVPHGVYHMVQLPNIFKIEVVPFKYHNHLFLNLHMFEPGLARVRGWVWRAKLHRCGRG